MTTYKNLGPISGYSPSGIVIPHSYIDAYMLYKKLSSSIAAKQTALEIRLDQAVFRKAEDTDPDKWRTEFTVLTDQYELDLIVEALTVVIQHSAMRDYCNVPLRLPVKDNALQMIIATDGHKFETVPFVKNGLTEDTYIPNILGIYVLGKIAVMASVGAFTRLSDENLQKLKQRMMAAALSLPDRFQTDGNPRVLDTIHLALIDCEIETSLPDKHVWSLKDIDQLVCVTGAAEAILKMRVLLSDHVQELLNRVADKVGSAEQAEPLKERLQSERPPKVQVAFMEPHQQGLG